MSGNLTGAVGIEPTQRDLESCSPALEHAHLKTSLVGLEPTYIFVRSEVPIHLDYRDLIIAVYKYKSHFSRSFHENRLTYTFTHTSF